MFLRYVVLDIDEDSHRRLGVFQACYELLKQPEITDYHASELRVHLDWFKVHLRVPERFAKSTRHGAHSKAISWFKDSANESIRRMHSMCRILDEYGRHTEVVKTDRPGYIVYEDEMQITAEPFSDTDV